MARILLGVTGGIAAYKALETARLATQASHAVRVIQTATSERFVGRASFAAITGAPVLTSEFEPDPARGAYPGESLPERAPISHLALVERAEAFLIAPASANTLAKLAHGHADNLLTTAALAATCPLAVAPAMNNHMYLHPATQANLELLAGRGVTVIPPGEGELASHGEHGVGRLPQPAELLAHLEAMLTPPSQPDDSSATDGRGWMPSRSALEGLRVLVSAGGTREPIDSVRYIGNRSSGRMGFALATEALRRGAEVTVLASNPTASPPPGARVIEAVTAAELLHAAEREFEACDVLLMAAAVADFRPARAAQTKLKKDQGPPSIELEATPDILGSLAERRRPGQVLVGFAAEHGADAIGYGRGKLTQKGLDAIVVNDISTPQSGFDVDENEVTIITARRERHVPRTSKLQVARAVLDQVEELLSDREGARAGARAGTGSPAGV